MNNQLTIKSAATETLPTVFGYLGIGMAFGIVSQSAGLGILMTTLLSIVDYAGSAQFIMISMLLARSSMPSIIIAVFLVNSRMIIQSMTLAPHFRKDSMLKNILLGSFLTDESFALAVNKLNFTNHKLSFRWFNTSNLMSYTTWVVASFLGALVTNVIPNPQKLGINFVIIAMFIGLLYLQFISDRVLSKKLQLTVIGAVLILVYFGMIVIPSDLLILVVTLLGCFVGVLIKHAVD